MNVILHFYPDPLLYYKMIILQYHEIFFRLTAPRCPGMAAGAVNLRKSHAIVILSFCNIVKGQANNKKNVYLIVGVLWTIV